MKILAIMTVKNEEDIVAYVLKDALNWADSIVVLDNNSTDGTLSIIKEICTENKNVFFWGTYEGPFHDWLRSLVFNDYKHLISVGDWVCRLDADEFYIDDPKTFLKTLPEDIDFVYSASFQYYYTEIDAVGNTQNLPAHQRMRFYACNHSEKRFCKIKKNTFWPVTREWPFNTMKIAENRIRLKHFQYRSKEQMEKRFFVRETVNNDCADGKIFIHELKNNKVFNNESLKEDDGTYIYNEKLLPALPKTGFLKSCSLKIIMYFFNLKFIRRIIYPTLR